ncbi:hypothetical protein [Streptosporangium sp. CA-115845]|uniref:hypothetical protein n=1 Tax=Streptosporangium sp. CA-115845 TaxID=3240071 RepID=UPI003D907322
MSEFIWEEPPVWGFNNAKYHREAEVLKSRPGEWCRLFEFSRQGRANTLTQTIKKGQAGFAPMGAFEAVTRTVKSGQTGDRIVYVYARYKGVAELSSPSPRGEE